MDSVAKSNLYIENGQNHDCCGLTDLVFKDIDYSTDDGSEVVFYDTALGEFRTNYLRVSRDILQAEIDAAEIIEADI